MTASGSTLYFVASDGTNGRELWKSDGTANGTVMVKDIYPGTSGSYPNGMAVIGSTLYFLANDGTNGRELWKSDGTTNGTVMVKDINSAGNGLSWEDVTVLGNTLYFNADDGTNGWELWTSDGTSAGTVMVKDINPGSNSAYPYELTVVGSTLYFEADDGTNGRELWKSDGTSAGTVMVKDIHNCYSCNSNYAYPANLTVIGNTLYFQADDGSGFGRQLWKTDGTSAGTVMLRSPGVSPYELIAIGTILYFVNGDPIYGSELWWFDTTA
jgi:ELWxxDGT repeat protein